MKRLLLCWMVVFVSTGLMAETSPGSIREVQTPEGWQYGYDATTDTHNFAKDSQAEIVLFWLPSYGMDTVFENLLVQMGMSGVPVVRDTFIGSPSLAIEQPLNGINVSFRLTELPDGYAVTIISSVPEISTWVADIETLFKSIRVAPKSTPPALLGTFQTASELSTSYSEELGSASYNAYVTLWENGLFTDQSYTSVTQPSAAAASESETAGVWEARGNRLYFRSNTGLMSAFRFEAFSNGLELHQGEGEPLLWVRQ